MSPGGGVGRCRLLQIGHYTGYALPQALEEWDEGTLKMST